MTKKSRSILITIIILAAGMAIAVPLAISYHNKHDFSKMTPQQIRQFFDSNEFRDANEDKRREIRQEMQDAMEKRMENQANEYAALTPDAKTVYLDKIIDDMQARRAEFLARRDANDANGPPDPNRFRRFGPRDPNSPRRQMGQQARAFRPPEPSRTRQRSERVSTDTRMKMAQFRQDLMNRMQERGIQMGPGRGGFGAPGGFGGPGGPPPGGR